MKMNAELFKQRASQLEGLLSEEDKFFSDFTSVEVDLASKRIWVKSKHRLQCIYSLDLICAFCRTFNMSASLEVCYQFDEARPAVRIVSGVKWECDE